MRVEQTGALFRFSGGDARKLLNIIDILCNATEGEIVINDENVTECLQQNIALYDKNGEQHYDVISAFIKSVRGSDPTRRSITSRGCSPAAKTRSLSPGGW